MEYEKKHEFLICIDSDGTAIDSMNIKHKKCFGPCFVQEFGLNEYEQEALAKWDNVNLYSKTRGKNRFITLLICLEHFQGKGYVSENLTAFKEWVENTAELSNGSLKKEIEKKQDIILIKALNWSISTNDAISKLTFDDIQAFSSIKEFLEFAKERTDIAVVSSANLSAVNSEWTHFGLLEYVDAVATQEIGSKTACINALLEKGYNKEKVLMVGDAPPDLQAAKQSGVLFYPVITGQEQKSWADLKNKYFADFTKGCYNQEEQIDKFENIFASNKE